MQDLEFTVERGKLYMLQTRSGKRSAEAAVKIALDLVREGLITKAGGDRARRARVSSSSCSSRASIRDEKYDKARERAQRIARRRDRARSSSTPTPRPSAGKTGEAVILVRNETAPDDVHGMIASKGVAHEQGRRDVARRGRRARHGAAVRLRARSAGDRPRATKTATIGGRVLHEGDWITIDGTHRATS